MTVLLTLRADFLGNALQHPALAEVLEDAVITIGQMRREQLRAVIEGPLPPDVRYEAGLVERILGDVGNDPGSLPLLEFALTLLWERQQGGLLTHAAYQELGGVDGALASYAERVYADQLLPEDQEEVRRLFVQLVRPTEVGSVGPARRAAGRAGRAALAAGAAPRGHPAARGRPRRRRGGVGRAGPRGPDRRMGAPAAVDEGGPGLPALAGAAARGGRGVGGRAA